MVHTLLKGSAIRPSMPAVSRSAKRPWLTTVIDDYSCIVAGYAVFRREQEHRLASSSATARLKIGEDERTEYRYRASDLHGTS